MEKSDQVAAAAAEGSGAAHELWNLGDGRVAVDCGIAEVEGDFRMAVSQTIRHAWTSSSSVVA